MEYDLPRYGYKEMPCRICGLPTIVSVRKKKAPRCVECGIDAYIQSQLEITQKQGPTYDKWRAGIARALGEYSPGTPPHETGVPPRA